MSFARIARHTMIQVAGRALSTFLGVLALAAVTRYLGAEQFGWYTTVFTFLQFFAILADFGFTLIGGQMIAEPNANEEKILSNLFSLRLIVSTLFFGSALMLIWFFPYPTVIKYGVLILTASLFATSLQNVFLGLFQKHLRLSYVAIGDVAGRALILGGYILMIWFQAGLLAILAVSVIANIAQFVILFYYSRHWVKIKLCVDRIIYKEILCRSWPIAISMAFNLIYLRADIIILSLARSQTEVGLYGAAYRVIDVAASIPVLFMGIMLPHLTAAWHSDKEKFSRYFRRAFDFMSILGLPLVLGGYFLARPLMVFLAGAEFADSGKYLQILLVALLAIFFGALSGHLIVAINKQRQMVWGYLVTAFLTMIGYLIFIPRYGAIGAGWMTVFSEILIMILTLVVLENTIRLWPSFRVFVKSLVGSLLMLLSMRFFPWPHFLLNLLVGAAVYGAAMILMKGVTKKALRDILRS